MTKLTLIVELPDGKQQRLALSELQNLSALNGAVYTLVEQDTQQAPEELVLKRKGDDLEIEVEGEAVAHIDGFYSADMSTIFSADGTLMPAEGMAVRSSDVLESGSESDEAAVVWSAQGSHDFLGLPPLAWVGGLLLGGSVGTIALTGGGGGGGTETETVTATDPDSKDSSADALVSTASSIVATDDQGSKQGRLTSGDTTDDTALVLSGTNEADSSVEIYDGEKYLGDAVVTGTTWRYEADITDGTTYQLNVKETDSAGNESAASSNFEVTGDMTAPIITTVSIPDAAMKVGDAVAVTVTASEAGLSFISGTVNGMAVTDFKDNGGGSYSATYTVAEGDDDIAADGDIPVGFVLADAAGNNSEAYIAPISQGSDAIDANTPTITTVTIPDTTMKIGDTVVVTLTVADDGGDTYSNISGTIGGFTLSNLVRTNSTTYTAAFTVIEGGTDVAEGDDILVSLTVDDSAGNTSDLYSEDISQANDEIDANSPTLTSSDPADESSGDESGNVALEANIVLTFDEPISLGTKGSIVITSGEKTKQTITIDVASSELTISDDGTQLTINPTDNLVDTDTRYHVTITEGAVTDTAGNAYAGISTTDITTFNFTTEAVNTSIVVFDFVRGVSSDHDGGSGADRHFEVDVSYDLYLVVDSSSSALATEPTGSGATWGTWTGADNLGNDDHIYYSGNGGESWTLALATVTSAKQVINLEATDDAAQTAQMELLNSGLFKWSTVNGTDQANVWGGTVSPNMKLDEVEPSFYQTMPSAILISQGLI